VSNKPRDLQILCLRHGKTHYTGQPRDLTPEGEAHVRQVAKDVVLPWMDTHRIDARNLKIRSSSAPRAHFTAWSVSDVIQEEKRMLPTLLPQQDIGPTVQRDKVRAAQVYESLRAGQRHVSYEQEPDFQDPTIFETPREVRARWYAFLARYIMYNFDDHAIFVSHYEVLCNLVHDLFGIVATKETELRHAEPIYLSVSEYDADSGLVMLSGKFRGQSAMAVFCLWDESIERRL
jgi:phosphohistidine phosphatase SixA